MNHLSIEGVCEDAATTKRQRLDKAQGSKLATKEELEGDEHEREDEVREWITWLGA